MESNRSSTMLAWSDWMGHDLLVEIFMRLPIQTLCRLRCVCKSWNSLISSNSFINIHHCFASSSALPPNLKPYLLVHGHSYTLRRPQPSVVNHLKQDVYFPFQCRDPNPRNFTFVDVIHGVVCVSVSLQSSFDSITIWNPAIHKYVALPWLPFPLDIETAVANFIHAAESLELIDFVGIEGGYVDIDAFNKATEYPDVDGFLEQALFECSVIGFGYDNSKNDFKVVRIWLPSDEINSCCNSILPTYEVYSAQEGIWRVAIADNLKSCGFFVEDCVGKNTGCFVNGTIHWIVHDPGNCSSSRSMLMFDCELEEVRTVEIPQELFQGGSLYLEMTDLLEYCGMLSVMMNKCLGFDSETLVELWVMEVHGVATSWNKLYRFQGAFGFTVYQPSFVEQAPYGPNQWNKFRSIDKKRNRILSGHVYQESMFLMDHPTAQSYTKEDTVSISVEMIQG